MASRVLTQSVSLLALAALFGTLPAAFGQQYQTDPIESRLSAKGAIARNFISRGTGSEQDFRDYIEKYFFPAMTQADADSLSGLEKLHGNLFKNFLYKSTGPTQKYLHDQAMAFCLKVLRARYHPSVRYNALLILGKLDDKYPTADTKSVPSAKANSMLCSLANRALTKGRAPRYELVGSLVGLERHAKLLGSLPAAQKRNTARILHTVLSTDQLPGEYAPGVRDWIYLRAAMAASNLRPLDRTGAFTMVMTKRVADDSIALEARAKMAGLIRELQPAADRIQKSAAVVAAIADVTAEVSKQESEIATTFEDLQIGGRGRMIGQRGAEARRIQTSADRQVVLVREGLLEVLVDLKSALQAIEPLADQAMGRKIAAVSSAVDNAIEAASNKNTVDLNVADKVKRLGAVVTQTGFGNTAKQEPAEEPTEQTPALASVPTAP